MKAQVKAAYQAATTDSFEIMPMVLKLVEETGELAEAVNHKLGHLPNKKMKEPLEGEVADVILCAIGVLVKAYPEESFTKIYDRLVEHLDKKSSRWLERNK